MRRIDKALPGFRVSSSGFLGVNAGLYGSAQVRLGSGTRSSNPLSSRAESGELRSCDNASTLAGPAAGLRELFSARGFNGLRGRLNLITLVATPVMILAGGIRPYERSLGF